jgi:phosphoribosylanthranilate isomerase
VRSLDGAIQIAGVHDLDEALGLVAAGVTHVGLPLRLPDGREDLPEADAARVCAGLRGRADSVLITYQTDADAIAAFADQLGCDWVQLHGRIAADAVARLRRRRPRLGLIAALVVEGPDPAPGEAAIAALAPHVDGFITDTFDPATGRRGATGLTHDWAVSRALVAASPHPVILAGGLTAANVADAIRAVGPAAVDAHTGVEGADGRKDPARVAAFVDAAEAALAAGRRR